MRLFVALNLPPSTREALARAVRPLVSRDYPVRWTRADAIHLTLKFLGEADESRLPELAAALERAARGARPLPLAIGGFGAFPAAERPRVVWVGIAPDPALELLQHAVEREFEPLGFPGEARPFRPHLTLGRATSGAKPRAFQGFAEALEALAFAETVLVSSVELMKSTPGGNGSVYEEVARGRLS